jgi:hypothetical protein
VSPLVSLLIQMAMLGVVVVVALAAGRGLARLVGDRATLALLAEAGTTVVVGAGLWFFVHDRLQKVETDQVAVATLVASVVGVLWLAGMATGYALSRPRG